MRGKVIVDLRNVYDRAEAEEAGFDYFGLGRGRVGGGPASQAGQQRSRSGCALSVRMSNASNCRRRPRLCRPAAGGRAGAQVRGHRPRHRSASASPSCARATTERARSTKRSFSASSLELTDARRAIAAAPTSTSSPCRRRSMRRTVPTLAPCLSATAHRRRADRSGSAARRSSTKAPSIPGSPRRFAGPRSSALAGLKRGRDFRLGYSPERINPGDREHTHRPDHQGHRRRGRRGRRAARATSTAR